MNIKKTTLNTLSSLFLRVLFFFVTFFVTMQAHSQIESLEAQLGTPVYNYLRKSGLFTEKQWEYFDLLALKVELVNAQANHNSFTIEWSEDYIIQNAILDSLNKMIPDATEALAAEPFLNDSDPEVATLADEELTLHNEKLRDHSDEVLDQLWSMVTPEASGHVMVEVKPAERRGNQPIAIGAMAHFYNQLAIQNNWDSTVVSSKESSYGESAVLVPGSTQQSHAFILIKNPNAYRHLFLESGTHKFIYTDDNKVGLTADRNSKSHTAYVEVKVYAAPKTNRFLFKERDIKFEFSRSSGAGGQNVNKRDTAVRALHQPTGLTVYVQQERTQESNRRIAVEMLRTMAYSLHLEENQRISEEAQNSNPVNRDGFVRIYNLKRDPVQTVTLLEGKSGFDNYDLWQEHLEVNLSAMIAELGTNLDQLSQDLPSQYMLYRAYSHPSTQSTVKSCKSLLLN